MAILGTRDAERVARAYSVPFLLILAKRGDSMSTLPLADWRDFYVMIGTAAGVIVGATFVVASLASGLEKREIGMRGFITPTAVHLGSVLVGSALLAVPTLTPLAFAIILGAGGIAGAAYSIKVAARIRKMKLDLSDISFYMALPIIAYGTMVAAAAMAFRHIGPAFETLAASYVLLLIVGMRNAWDMANFMITRQPEK